MNTNREICIAEGLLLCTWFIIDVLTLNPTSQNVFTTCLVSVFMAATALYVLSFWFRKSRSIVSLAKALWNSNYFDAMVSISIALPWMGYAFESDNLSKPLSYVCWALAVITLLIGLFAKRDRTIPSESSHVQ